MAGAKGLLCKTIYDFESPKDLNGLYYKCHTWFALDERNFTSGKKGLRLEMYPPGDYPGLSLKDLKGPWRKVVQVRLDIFNPEARDIQMTVRIDDRDDNPPYEDRVNERVLLHPGWNNLVLDLRRLVTSGTKRHLAPKKICALMIFIGHPKRPVTIFVDNIRLCKEN